MEKMIPVLGSEKNEVVNKAIAVCNKLSSEDGREFHIVRWTVDVPLDSEVRIDVTVIPYRKSTEADQAETV